MKEPEGRFGILESGASSADALRDRPDGVLLADHPLVEFVFHAQQLLGFLLGQLVHRDAGPDAENLGDRFLVHLIEEIDTRGLDLALHLRFLGEQFLLLVTQASGGFEVLGLDRVLLPLDDAAELLFDLLERGRGCHPLDSQAGSRFVDEVDRLVGQLTIGDVAVSEVGGRDEGLVGDRDPMV